MFNEDAIMPQLDPLESDIASLGIKVTALESEKDSYIEARRCVIAFIIDGEYDQNAIMENAFYSKGVKIGFAPQYTTVFPNNSKETYLAWQSKGHEILAHSSYTLKDGDYDDAVAKGYIKSAYTTLTRYGFKIYGFIGASGKIADKYIPTVKRYFRYCASENNHSGSYTGTGAESCLYFGTNAPFHLWRYSMQTSTLQQMKDAVDRAIDTTGLLLFYGHAQSANVDNFTVENVSALLDYIASKSPDISVMTPSEAVNKFYTIRYNDIDTVKADLDDVEEEIAKTEPILDDYFKTEPHTNVTTNNMTWTEGKYFDLNTGEEKSLNGYSHTDKFSCETGDVISIGLNTGQVLFWGADGYLLYVATSGSTAMQITAPADATLYACNNRDVNHRPTETTVTKTWTEKVLKVTEYSAPARVLYNSDAFINKRYANTANGNLLTGDSYASWYCVYKVPCEANRHYRTTTQAQVCFYNAQGTFISAYIPTMNDANITGTRVEMDFVPPNNCAFFSINSNYANETVFDLDYAEYGNSKSVYNLIGKTIVCFGDSITGNYRFGDNYPYQIEEKTGAKVYNVGFGGCRMELTNESSILYVNPFSMVSLADAIVSEASDKWSTQDSSVASFAAKGIVYKRLEMLKNIDFSQVDIITIAYGTNGLGLPLDDSADSLNTYTYAGATRYAIKTLLTKYPHLRIVLMTPIYRWYSATSDDGDTHQVNGQTLLDRVTKLLEVGAEIKIPTIDLYHSLGINKYNYTGYFGDDDETADGTHINSFGREQMGLRVAGELIRLM